MEDVTPLWHCFETSCNKTAHQLSHRIWLLSFPPSSANTGLQIHHGGQAQGRLWSLVLGGLVGVANPCIGPQAVH